MRASVEARVPRAQPELKNDEHPDAVRRVARPRARRPQTPLDLLATEGVGRPALAPEQLLGGPRVEPLAQPSVGRDGEASLLPPEDFGRQPALAEAAQHVLRPV